jgi:hypothetical protein
MATRSPGPSLEAVGTEGNPDAAEGWRRHNRLPLPLASSSGCCYCEFFPSVTSCSLSFFVNRNPILSWKLVPTILPSNALSVPEGRRGCWGRILAAIGDPRQERRAIPSEAAGSPFSQDTNDGPGRFESLTQLGMPRAIQMKSMTVAHSDEALFARDLSKQRPQIDLGHKASAEQKGD